MSRKTDLEQSIRESYSLIREYEDVIRLSDRPKEKLRAKREIEEQWGLIEGYLVDYLPLAGEDVPDDIGQVSQRAQSWEKDLERLSALALFGSLEERRAYRNRQMMIERVRNDWIKDMLEQSLYQVARIELGLMEQPEAVERPWSMIVQEQGRPARELPQGVRMSKVFDELGGTLLILGAPGTGKTTMLLELASDLLDRATRDPEHLIPVYFPLSSRALRRRPLDAWMIDELAERYLVPKEMAQSWVEQEAVLPLLDGLDEVAKDHRVACAEAINVYRQEHGRVPMAVCGRTDEVAALGIQLRLRGAVAIGSLTRGQVDAYLERAGPALSSVREVLAKDETLYELLDTPLMLSVATLAYKGESASALQAAGTVEERRERLFTAYVEAMHGRRGAEGRYAPEKTERWLAWLAWQMHEHEQSVFLLKAIQPNWLSKPLERWIASAVSTLQVGLGLGLLVGLAVGLGVGVVVGVVISAIAGWVCSQIQLRIPARHAKMNIADRPIVRVIYSIRSASTVGLTIGLVAGLVLGLAPGLFFDMDVGLGVEVVIGLFSSWICGRLAGTARAGLSYLQHLTLRYLLVRNNLAPWQYTTFLDYATERIFLYKVGGGYIFVHRLLKDHFAELWEREYGGAE